MKCMYTNIHWHDWAIEKQHWQEHYRGPVGKTEGENEKQYEHSWI